MIARETIQVNVRLSEDLVELIDKAVNEYHFTNRQELVKSAIRDFLKKEVPA
jgi:metal-responsive CopG/Arc/MetJ family transcriptional regulator